ncbi:hypothetical protein [Primorskyibacter flagellatus]|uniref:hypothetical protein n=1 Tax=Primorskyibacter flagellatus TaxID=1387277 RepID=UPI003A9028EB
MYKVGRGFRNRSKVGSMVRNMVMLARLGLKKSVTTEEPKDEWFDAFQVNPRALIFSKQRIVVSFSPKSACSHVVTWFFLKERLLAAANYYHPWPHNFRTKVYYDSAQFRRRRNALLANGQQDWTLIKVTRDPVKRLVAILRHAVRFPIADEIALQRGINIKRDGLSLREFGEVLKTVDLTRAARQVDTHLCSQIHPIWDMPFGRTITLNLDEVSLNDGLNDIERSLGLEVTNFSAHPKFDEIRESHYVNNDQDLDTEQNPEDVKFRRNQVERRFPKTVLQKLPYTSELAHHLYPDDFSQVVTNDTKGELFRTR